MHTIGPLLWVGCSKAARIPVGETNHLVHLVTETSSGIAAAQLKEKLNLYEKESYPFKQEITALARSVPTGMNDAYY